MKENKIKLWDNLFVQKYSVKHILRASTMVAQQVKTLANNPDDMSSSPGTQMVEEENYLLQVVVLPPYAHYGIYA